MTAATDVAIIGAGPYGLSIAAHLKDAGVQFRIFGQPMLNWRTRMPRGMHLKSDGFASNLYDPERRFTLRNYCRDNALPYSDLGLPVPVEVFSAYGTAFQSQCVPSLDTRTVRALERQPRGFKLTLDDGTPVEARRVVVATGISDYEFLPEILAQLPTTVCSHTADNHDLAKYRDKDVVVIGRGASSTDTAALLRAAGARAQIVSREPIEFHMPPSGKPRTVWERLRDPNFGLGPNFRSAVYTLFPGVFHFLPVRLRQRIVRRHLGPAAVWFIRDQLVGHVPLHSGYEVTSAAARDGKASLIFSNRAGQELRLEVDHVICGTGYQVALERLPFLAESLRSQVELEGTSPRLSRHFEASVPGLYFVGLASAVAFGPLTRFALGAKYTARTLARHLRASRSHVAVENLVGARS